MPNWILVIILAIVFTAVLSIAQGMYWAYVARLEREQEEVRRRLSGGSTQEVEETLFREQQADEAAKALGNTGAAIQQIINQADSKLTVTQLMGRMIGGGVLGAVGGGVMFGPLGMMFGVVGAVFPYQLLKYQASRRSEKLVSQLPDALDLMARSLQAGLGLNDAFRLVAEEMPMPVAGEFGRVFEEVRFGRDYREAFQKMMTRNGTVFDLRLMVSSILLQRETGGNLIEILENISTMIRTRFTFQAKVRAMTSEAKFTAMILGGLPLGVLTILYLSNPQYLSTLFTDIKGNLLLAVDMTMYCTGVMVMRDMSNVKV